MMYLNGRFIQDEQATIPITDRGLLLGDGIFETVHAVCGVIPFQKQHWERMKQSLDLLGIPSPINEAEFNDALQTLLIKNSLHKVDAGIRITVTRGCARRGVAPPVTCQPNCFIIAFPLQSRFEQRVKMITATIRRNEYSPITKIKSINYLDNIMAKQEAIQQNVDEALFLNTKGHVTETTVSNIFMVKDNILFTPPTDDGLLPGVMRSFVLRNMSKLQIVAKEMSISPEILAKADEVFLTNSLLGIQPVSQLDKHTYAANNPMTNIIQQFYQTSLKTSREESL